MSKINWYCYNQRCNYLILKDSLWSLKFRLSLIDGDCKDYIRHSGLDPESRKVRWTGNALATWNWSKKITRFGRIYTKPYLPWIPDPRVFQRKTQRQKIVYFVNNLSGMTNVISATSHCEYGWLGWRKYSWVYPTSKKTPSRARANNFKFWLTAPLIGLPHTTGSAVEEGLVIRVLPLIDWNNHKPPIIPGKLFMK